MQFRQPHRGVHEKLGMGIEAPAHVQSIIGRTSTVIDGRTVGNGKYPAGSVGGGGGHDACGRRLCGTVLPDQRLNCGIGRAVNGKSGSGIEAQVGYRALRAIKKGITGAVGKHVGADLGDVGAFHGQAEGIGANAIVAHKVVPDTRGVPAVIVAV